MVAPAKRLMALMHKELHLKAWLVHKSEHFCHMTYLAAVSWEAHGMFAHAAQVLLFVTVVGVFVKDQE